MRYKSEHRGLAHHASSFRSQQTSSCNKDYNRLSTEGQLLIDLPLFLTDDETVYDTIFAYFTKC